MKSSNLRKLEEFEATKKYVFHGSPYEIEIFEPKQAYNYINGVNIPDDKPAVFTSSYLNYAIFMAICNKINCTKGVQTSTNGTVFRATKETLLQLDKNSTGYVYVFSITDFKEREIGDTEFIRFSNIRPLHTYQVGYQDITFLIEEL